MLSQSAFQSLGSNPNGPKKCVKCKKTAYIKESLRVDDITYHKTCFRCVHCNSKLSLGAMAMIHGNPYCKPHFKQLFAENGGKYDRAFGSPFDNSSDPLAKRLIDVTNNAPLSMPKLNEDSTPDLPGDTPKDLPGDTPKDLPGDTPKDLPGHTPTKPGDTPTKPGDTPGDLPGDTPQSSTTKLPPQSPPKSVPAVPPIKHSTLPLKILKPHPSEQKTSSGSKQRPPALDISDSSSHTISAIQPRPHSHVLPQSEPQPRKNKLDRSNQKHKSSARSPPYKKSLPILPNQTESPNRTRSVSPTSHSRSRSQQTKSSSPSYEKKLPPGPPKDLDSPNSTASPSNDSSDKKRNRSKSVPYKKNLPRKPSHSVRTLPSLPENKQKYTDSPERSARSPPRSPQGEKRRELLKRQLMCFECELACQWNDSMIVDATVFHKWCLHCTECQTKLPVDGVGLLEGYPYCEQHFKENLQNDAESTQNSEHDSGTFDFSDAPKDSTHSSNENTARSRPISSTPYKKALPSVPQ